MRREVGSRVVVKDVKVADPAETYADGTPVRRNKRGVKLKQFAGSGGKPPLEYDPTYHPEQARELALLGLTDAGIAKFFRISERTLYNWKKTYPALFAAIEAGGSVADAKVARSLYQRAIGYSYQTKKLFFDPKRGQVIEHDYIEHHPPDVGAATQWLANRQRALWRSRNKLTLSEANGEPADPPTLVIRAF